jgi:hypothetical protein
MKTETIMKRPTAKELLDDPLLMIKTSLEDVKAGRVRRVR